MTCRKPHDAWFSETGQITFNRAKARGPAFLMPCGQCMPCRVSKQSELALRIQHEAKMFSENAFVTLTYDDEHLPPFGDLDKRSVQLFMKRLRFRFDPVPVRFFACGEYGETFKRPHYHVVLFGVDFPDKVLVRGGDYPAYSSELLSSLWRFGFAECADVTPFSCNYVAGYVLKKMSGPLADEHYEVVDGDGVVHRRPSEFSLRSAKPGIGATFFDKFGDEIVAHNSCIAKGKEVPVPAYYRRRYEKSFPVDADWRKYDRSIAAEKYCEDHAADLTPERREVRARVLELELERRRNALD